MAGRTDPEKVKNTDFNGGTNYTSARTMVSDREMDKLVEGVLYAQKKAEEAANLVAGDNISITYKEDGTAVMSSTANNAFINLDKLVENGVVSISALNTAIANAYASKDPACARVNIYIGSETGYSVNLTGITFLSNCNYYFGSGKNNTSFYGEAYLTSVRNCDFYNLNMFSGGETDMVFSLSSCSNIQFFNCSFRTLGSICPFVLTSCSDIYLDNCQFASTLYAISISDSANEFKWIMFENCIFHMSNANIVLYAGGATNSKEIITFANCYYSDMTLVTKDYVYYNPNGARINVALYEITSLSTEQVNEIADGVFGN